MSCNKISLDCLNLSDFVVLDLETTGLIPYRAGITEIAAIKCVNGEVVEEFQTLVNPERHIPNGIVKLTGISNDMVESAPTVSEIMPIFSKFLGDFVVVGHNVSFDFRFLTHYHYETMGSHLSNETVCTLKLARALLPELPSKKLGVVCDYFDIKNERAHRAMGDTCATLEVFRKYQEMVKNYVGEKTNGFSIPS